MTHTQIHSIYVVAVNIKTILCDTATAQQDGITRYAIIIIIKFKKTKNTIYKYIYNPVYILFQFYI